MSNAADLAKIQKAEIELAQLEAEYGKIVAEASLAGASMLPPPAGTAADIASLTISLSKGNWGDALLDAVGFIPIAGDVIKGGIKGTKIANKMKNVEIALKAARAKLLQKELALKNDPKELQKKTAEACKKGGVQPCPNMGGEGKNSAIEQKDAKPPLKKGEVDEYGNLQKKTGDGTIHRDHQPSKAALQKRAEKLKGSPLTKAEIKRINKEATAVNVPEDIHRAGPTYGGKNKELIEPDSNDLAGATKRDSDAMIDNAKNMDPKDIDIYKKAADNVTKKDNTAYDDWLLDRLDE